MFVQYTKHELYKRAIAADDEWHNELVRLFGKNAGDVRYTKRGKGAEGTMLRRLHDEARRACDEWREA